MATAKDVIQALAKDNKSLKEFVRRHEETINTLKEDNESLRAVVCALIADKVDALAPLIQEAEERGDDARRDELISAVEVWAAYVSQLDETMFASIFNIDPRTGENLAGDR